MPSTEHSRSFGAVYGAPQRGDVQGRVVIRIPGMAALRALELLCMKERCHICQSKPAVHKIPANGIDMSDGYYPVCADQHCKYEAWTLVKNPAHVDA